MKKLFKIFFCSILLIPRFLSATEENSAKENWIDSNGHKIRFRTEYKMYLYPALYKLPENKKYIKNIYSSMIFDQIRLNRKITINNPFPSEIRYNNELTDEDPKEKFIESFKSDPMIFSLQVLPAAAFPSSIKDPAQIISDKEVAGLLKKEDIHTISFVSSKGKSFLFKVFLIRNEEVIYHDEMMSSETDLSKNLYVFFQNISVFLSRSETAEIQITSSETKSSVYFNGQFAGFAPLNVPNIIHGENLITVRKPGYKPWEKTVNINPHDKLKFNAIMVPYDTVSTIIVKSDPESCDVYIGVEYKGQTPVEINNVPPGKHRIHVVKKGYIDFYSTIEVSEAKETRIITANLKKGDSERYYTPGQPVFLGLNHEELFKTSGYITLGTGITGIAFLVAKDSAAAGDIAAFDGLSTGFFIGTGAFFIATVYFYIKFIGELDLPVVLNTDIPDRQNASVKLNVNFSPEIFNFGFKKHF